MIHRLPLLIVALGFALCVAPKTVVASDDHLNSALPAARAWVAKIDATQYDTSYGMSCDAMRNKVTPEQWTDVLKAFRLPWGPVISRTEVSHVYKPDGIEKLEGECMVITYDTKFKNLPLAMEVVVVKWEGGKWLGAGYNVGAKTPPDGVSASTTPEPQTDTTTETVKNPPQALPQ